MLSYVDDNSTGTETEAKHLTSVEKVLAVLYKSRLRLKLSKCSFGKLTVEILGHRITPDGVLPSEGHIQAIRLLTKPGSGDGLMIFSGLVNYFLQFVDHFLNK